MPTKKTKEEVIDVKTEDKVVVSVDFSEQEFEAMGKIFDLATKQGGIAVAPTVAHFMVKMNMQIGPNK